MSKIFGVTEMRGSTSFLEGVKGVRGANLGVIRMEQDSLLRFQRLQNQYPPDHCIMEAPLTNPVTY